MASREGRLKPEFEAWYPSLRAGEWYAADHLTATVLEQLRSGAPQWRSEDRVPSDAHFEFRGGDNAPRARRRTRHLDRDRRGGSAQELPRRGLNSLINLDEGGPVDGIELSYRSVTGDVYHIDLDCPQGRMIPAEWRVAGPGELRPCPTCRARAEARRAVLRWEEP